MLAAVLMLTSLVVSFLKTQGNSLQEGNPIMYSSKSIIHRTFIKICQNTPQLCWGMNGFPSPLGGEG
jgi:hypothetical protein